MWKTLRHSNRNKQYASIPTYKSWPSYTWPADPVFCYSNYAQYCLFKVGQLIVVRYTSVQTTYWEDALMQTKVILTSESAYVILIAYSRRADKLD